MLAKHLAVTVIALLPMAGNASAQTLLQWKFAKGNVYEAQRITTQKQAVEINGKVFKQTRESTWHVRLEVKDEKAAAFVVEAMLTKVEHRVTGAAPAEVMDPKLHERIQGSVFTLDVTTAGTIQAMRGYEEFLKRLGGSDKGRLKALEATLPEVAVKEALADLFGPLPADKVAPGDSWRREVFEPIPHFGGLRSSVRYLHVGAAANRTRIVYTVQTKYEPPKKDGASLFQVRDGSIDSDKATGEIVFDHVAGRLISHDRSMRLRGKLTIEALDRRQALEFTSENEVKIRVKPAAK